MKISLEWLQAYLSGPLDAQAAADALTNGGLPVETIDVVDGDPVLDVEVTSNRSDCLSTVGVARELAALLNREFRDVPVPQNEPSAGSPGLKGLRIQNPELCPYYTARVIRGVRIAPSPAWMQRRLAAIGVRSINNVVDVTNYVMFELGQPLHAFDLNRVSGAEIVVRTAAEGEKLVSLDGHERTLSPSMLVIADAQRPIALAGVMGGRDTEVTPATTDILLESARFEPLCIRNTARALAMGSDSSYRYERGIDPGLAKRASDRAAELIAQLGGGTTAGPLLAAGNASDKPKQLWLRFSRLHQVLGVEWPVHEVVYALSRLRLSPVLRGERVDVTVPTYRLDLNLEIDLVEEVARVLGYDRVPVREEIQLRVASPDPQQIATRIVRDALVAGGYFEAVTFTFVSDALAAAFLPKKAASLPRVDARVRKADAQLRPSILPGLLEAVRRNESVGIANARLFEIGSVFWNDAAGLVQEKRTLSLVGAADYREVRGVVELLLHQLNPDRSVSVLPNEHSGFSPGATGELRWGGETIGTLGRVDRAVTTTLGLREQPIAAELDLEPLLRYARLIPQLQPLPRYPAVRRDVSLVVADDQPYARLGDLIEELRLQHLEAAEYVTTYRGKPLAPATKSVTVTLVFRSSEATLTSDVVETAVRQLVQAAESRLGATLRV